MIEKLNTQGGSIAVLLFLTLVGMGAAVFGVPNAEAIMGGSFSAMLALMKSGRKELPEKPEAPK